MTTALFVPDDVYETFDAVLSVIKAVIIPEGRLAHLLVNKQVDAFLRTMACILATELERYELREPLDGRKV